MQTRKLTILRERGVGWRVWMTTTRERCGLIYLNKDGTELDLHGHMNSIPKKVFHFNSKRDAIRTIRRKYKYLKLIKPAIDEWCASIYEYK